MMGWWDVLKQALEHWADTDDPHSESQKTVQYIRCCLMPQIERGEYKPVAEGEEEKDERVRMD